MVGSLRLRTDSGIHIADSELRASLYFKRGWWWGGCFNSESKILGLTRDFVVVTRCASPHTWPFDSRSRYQFGRHCDTWTHQRHVSSTGLV